MLDHKRVGLLLIGMSFGCDEGVVGNDVTRGRATQIGAEEFVANACEVTSTDGWSPIEEGGPTIEDLSEGLTGTFPVVASVADGGVQNLSVELGWTGRGGNGQAGVGASCDAWATYELDVTVRPASRTNDSVRMRGDLRFVDVDGVWRVHDAVAYGPLEDVIDELTPLRGGQGELVLVLDGGLAETRSSQTAGWPSPGKVGAAFDDGQEEWVASW